MVSSVLAGYQIGADRLHQIEKNMEVATRELFKRYEVAMEPENEIIEASQSAAVDWVLDFAEKLDRSIAEEFEVLWKYLK